MGFQNVKDKKIWKFFSPPFSRIIFYNIYNLPLDVVLSNNKWCNTEDFY
jgi:hypothetical protein